MIALSVNDLTQRFPLLLRRWQAIELCRQLGGSERTLRDMIATERISRHCLFGKQYRYVRDQIIAQFITQSESLPS